ARRAADRAAATVGDRAARAGDVVARLGRAPDAGVVGPARLPLRAGAAAQDHAAVVDEVAARRAEGLARPPRRHARAGRLAAALVLRAGAAVAADRDAAVEAAAGAAAGLTVEDETRGVGIAPRPADVEARLVDERVPRRAVASEPSVAVVPDA